ncbi:S1 family peptidase [Chryseobacterium arthrosphaerae]|uniref:S1 family peptidase n=1 Tax=Chryseobacterium arthrosphaerae TaxID=651561 RepID=UPI003D3480E9
MTNWSYPILIEFTNGSGTGFFIEKSKKSYLITAKHVLMDLNTNIFREKTVSIKYLSLDEQGELMGVTNFVINLELLMKNGKIYVHPEQDIIVLDIFEYIDQGEVKMKFRDEVDIVGEIKGSFPQFGESSIIKLQEIKITNDIYVFGYPTSIGIKANPQYDYNLPLIRKGIISQIYKDKGTIILDCQVQHGNSGGAVVQVAEVNGQTIFGVIGVQIEYIPYITKQAIYGAGGFLAGEVQDNKNSGYSVAVAMNSVTELIEKFN